MQKPIFSIGIIFKNEIRCLERCLKSLQPLRDMIPCEIVMADTGSTDGSREIAEQYADILFDFPWIDDFSAARNAVMDRCSGKWYLSIDADEWLSENVAELAAFGREKNLPRDFGGLTIRNYKSPGLEKDQNYVDFLAIRLARLSTGVRYQGCIHEAWKSPDGEILKTMSLSETMLYHDGYCYENKAAEWAKHDRNMVLLKRKLNENPDDLQTLVECTDSSKHEDAGSMDYARRAIELVEQKCYAWDQLGGVAYRNIVSVAQLHHLPGVEKWAARGIELFPDSMFTRIDMAYYAFVYYFDKKDYTAAVYWGETYQKGLADYHAEYFDTSQSTRGVLEFISPFWERKVSVLMPQVYLELGEPEKALAGIRTVKGSELEDPQQVELCVNMLMRLHRTTLLDTAETMSAFWDQINTAFPDEDQAKMRREEFVRTGSKSFTEKFRVEEIEKDGFLRHSFDVFTLIEEPCGLGTAARMLGVSDTLILWEAVAEISDWSEVPIAALSHALKNGVTFPLPEREMNVEEMDRLIARLSCDKDSFFLMVLPLTDSAAESWQGMLWVRGLLLAAARSYPWDSEERDNRQGMTIARNFARTEGDFLSRLYAPDVLREDRLCAIPPLHRFGWYCAQAFAALDNGDSAGYIRLLRQGLETCPEMKGMVEFLLEQLEERRKVQATPELLQLAEQVRTILAQYPADDPAVLMLKQSETYQKVAHLIEGPDLGVMGGLRQ